MSVKDNSGTVNPLQTAMNGEIQDVKNEIQRFRVVYLVDEPSKINAIWEAFDLVEEDIDTDEKWLIYENVNEVDVQKNKLTTVEIELYAEATVSDFKRATDTYEVN